MLKTVNVQDTEEFIYLGRGRKNKMSSSLANPFLLMNENQRPSVIQAYRQWLWQVIKDKDTRAKLIAQSHNLKVAPRWTQPSYKQVMSELHKLCDLSKDDDVYNLGCWCSPKECHVDVVIRAVNYLKEKFYV